MLRVIYDGDALFVEDVYIDRLAGGKPIPGRDVTCYSLATGESVVASFLDDKGASCTVILDWWKQLPPIVWFGLGFLGPAAALNEVTLQGRDYQGEGEFKATLAADTLRAEIRFGTEEGLMARSFATFKSGDEPEYDVYFRDGVPWSPDGPLRPSLITIGNLGEDGAVHRSQVFRSIWGDWASGECDTQVPQGSTVYDYRSASGRGRRSSTDRVLSMEQVALWAPLGGEGGLKSPRRYEMTTPEVTEQEPSSVFLSSALHHSAFVIPPCLVVAFLAMRRNKRWAS